MSHSIIPPSSWQHVILALHCGTQVHPLPLLTCSFCFAVGISVFNLHANLKLLLRCSVVLSNFIMFVAALFTYQYQSVPVLQIPPLALFLDCKQSNPYQISCYIYHYMRDDLNTPHFICFLWRLFCPDSLPGHKAFILLTLLHFVLFLFVRVAFSTSVLLDCLPLLAWRRHQSYRVDDSCSH